MSRGSIAVVSRARDRNLHFSTAVEEAIAAADIVFISVNTPTKRKDLGAWQASDLKWVEASARTVAIAARGHTIVVEKSTLPVRTAQVMKEILGLAEGSAIADLEAPGSGADRWRRPAGDRGPGGHRRPVGAGRAHRQCLLAPRESSLPARSTASPSSARRQPQSAARQVCGYGPKFLQAGLGFGGSCFQKDILNRVYLCRHYGLEEVAAYWEQVVTLNTWQQHRIARLVVNRLFGTVTGKRIVVLGFAYGLGPTSSPRPTSTTRA